MDPQGNPEAKLLQLLDHACRLGEFDQVKGGVSITLLPLVVHLQLAVLEPMLLNLPCKVDDDGLVDVLLVLGPGGPDRGCDHPCVWGARGQGPEFSGCILEHVFCLCPDA